MPSSYPEIRDFKGIYKQANSFTVPDGALEQAENAVVRSDGIISKTRGFYLYNDPGASTFNAFGVYQDKLIGIYADQVGYFTESGTVPNEVGAMTVAGGSTVEVSSRTSRKAESNNNFYFTTNNGVHVLEAYDGDVYKSGVPPALDLRANFLPLNGPVVGDSQVAFRIVYGRRDSNGNLKLGAPSDILVLTNLEVTSAWARVSNVVTVTTSSAHNLVTGMAITVAAASDGTDPVDAATYTATVLTSTTFTIPHTDPNDSGSVLIWKTDRGTRLECSIPTEITASSDYFAQIYRSSQTNDETVSPNADFKLAAERELTSAEIAAGFFFFDDDIPDILLGAELYTNPNSREGESQANHRAPLAEDITVFKNHMIYANCTTRHLLELGIVDTSAIASGDVIEVRVDSRDRPYVARTGQANQRTTATSVSGTGTITITYAAHGLLDDDVVYITNITGTLTAGYYVVSGKTTDTFAITATGLTASALEFQGVIDGTNATVTGSAWTRASNVVTVTATGHGLRTNANVSVSNSSGGTPEVDSGVYTVTVVDADTFTFAHTGTDDASGNTLDYDDAHMFFVDAASSSVAAQLRNTAQGLVKAINRDDSSYVYANYTSGITGTPGELRLQAQAFGGAIYVRADNSTAAGGVSPVLPTSFGSGTQVYSTNDVQQSSWYAGKIGEPEAVPLLNDFPTGSRNSALLRAVALRDSLILIKEDGVYRAVGDAVGNFSITPLDTTVKCLVADTVKVINNTVVMLSNQGVCRITDSSVQIISRDIEDDIQPILGDSDLDTYTSAVAYETDRLYMLSTKAPNQSGTQVTHLFNILNNGWTTTTQLFDQGIVGPSDRLFLLDTDGTIAKERKNQTKLDFSGQNYAITVNSVAADGLSAGITCTGAIPKAGWVIAKSDYISRIATVETTATNTYDVTFYDDSNIAAADSLIIYKKYKTTIKFAPFHAGLVGRTKHFSKMTVHLRNSAASRLDIYFTSNFRDASSFANWVAREAIDSGWGSGPYGFFPWGNADSINLQFGTQKATPAAILIPQTVARSTYIQPVIEHDQAGEPLNMQALSFVVRAYGERVAK